jgi:hypothetical protein
MLEGRAMDSLLRFVQGVFGASVAVALLLTFVWPVAVSSDPAHGGFKLAAIGTFAVFFVSLVVLLALRLARMR